MSKGILTRRHSAYAGIDYSLYENQYLTMYFNNNGVISFVIPTAVNSTYITDISYKVNNGNWVTTTNTSSTVTISITVVQGDIVQWKGNIPYNGYISSTNYAHFADDGTTFELYGNIMSLYWGDDFRNKELFPWSISNNRDYPVECIAYGLFQGTNVYNAEHLILPAQNLYTPNTQSAYHYACMFQNCANLIYPPAVLPAKIIGAYTYYQMFMGCTSLVKMPNMENIEDTVGRAAYRNMFNGCASLSQNTQQTIHMNKAGYQMCHYMFNGCTSMVNAPNIEVYSLDNNLALSGNGVASSFECMFYGCTALETPPERIDLDTIDNLTFCLMFANCTSLEYAPIINIRKINYINDTLTPNPGRLAFKEMFTGCTSIVDGSGINIYFPDTSEWSGEQTCRDMFKNCTYLENGPSINVNGNVIVNGNMTFSRSFWNCSNLENYDIELNYEIDSSATITTGEGYGNYQTFYNCTNIVSGPRITRLSLRTRELEGMFISCTSLRDVYIKCDEDNAGDAFKRWLYGTGTLSGVTRTVHQAGSATLPSNSVDGVPTGWTLDTADWTAQRYARMTIYLDEFPIYGVYGWYQDSDDQGRDDCIQHFIENIDECGEIFDYYGDTVTINNKTYFIWENREYKNIPNQETESVSILLTTTDNFYELTLNSLSNGYNAQITDLDKSFDWVYGICHSDNTVTYSKNDFLSLGKFMVKVVRNQG